MRSCTTIILVFWGGALLCAQNSFVNWENAHVHPLDITPNGDRVLAVNTADNRLEIFKVTAGSLTWTGSIPVGLDPVSVRARSDDEAWVVNHISDSVSVVDLHLAHVVATLQTKDEPCDVVFAGNPERAFVSCSQVNQVLVFDPSNLDVDPVTVGIFGEDPRAMAVSADGSSVFVAIFESGNGSTVLSADVVRERSSPYGGINPPPNQGERFFPEQNPENDLPPAVALIVKKNTAGQWIDDNDRDWTEFVSGTHAHLSDRVRGWNLPDHDIAIIDAQDLGIQYVNRLMNIGMNLAVNPNDGRIALIGTDAENERRFESNLNGVFLRVRLALIDPADRANPFIVDLNPHLTYSTSTLPQGEREMSLGDPRGIIWSSDGGLAYVCGMGSNNVVVIDSNGSRAGTTPTQTIDVGEGPTGCVLDESHARLYVLNRFEGSISIVDTALEVEVARVPFFDPTPAAIRRGRKHNYDTHETSGLGHIACASCHVDSRFDRLAWDLGDPAGDMKEFNQNCLKFDFAFPNFPPGRCRPWHPMKGPMVTQTLQDIIGKEPFHWRGDREGIEAFNGTFMTLQGDDEELTAAELGDYEDFLSTIHFPPNPYRNFDNSLPRRLPLTGHFSLGGLPLPVGDAVRGFGTFDEELACIGCHTSPTGLGGDFEILNDGTLALPIAAGPHGEHHHAIYPAGSSMLKIPGLRGLYDRLGLHFLQQNNLSGFGFRHDGTSDTLVREIAEGIGGTGASHPRLADLVALMLAFGGSDLPESSILPPYNATPSQDTHAAVGAQVTFNGANNVDSDLVDRADAMRALADAGAVGLVARGILAGERRGYTYTGAGIFQSDRVSEKSDWDALLQAASSGAELTLTVVPRGTEIRIGIDRDEDGRFDRDELDAGEDPADPTVPFVRGDTDGDGTLNALADSVFVLQFGFGGGDAPPCRDAADVDDDGVLNALADALYLLSFGFLFTEPPPAPFPTCGADLTPDGMGCNRHPGCR